MPEQQPVVRIPQALLQEKNASERTWPFEQWGTGTKYFVSVIMGQSGKKTITELWLSYFLMQVLLQFVNLSI